MEKYSTFIVWYILCNLSLIDCHQYVERNDVERDYQLCCKSWILMVRLSGFLRIIFDIYCIIIYSLTFTQSGPKKKWSWLSTQSMSILLYVRKYVLLLWSFSAGRGLRKYSTLTYCTCTVTGFVCWYSTVCCVINSVIELFYIGYYR